MYELYTLIYKLNVYLDYYEYSRGILFHAVDLPSIG